ncbi:MAG: YidC/Oxa1 family membrane protein insertase [Dictyoglomus sp.]|nr:YidC/Oxa1 family membrane protein insertase [Dictyoglomus sp.]MCX7845655.1 YidC/Oxa1 family membrane protein insertase [Dictyoglomaceae bacterium]MDW8189150.1 YidC/Oxa1 family membrane protein insertase [Dictyoglomus sp.]
MIQFLVDILGKILEFFYSWTNNYGLAIIFLVIFVRIILYPLVQAQLKSLLLMQKIQPEIQKLQQKFKDDPQALNREIMLLYRQYKINPAMGCLPLILQFPILIALYQLLVGYKYATTPTFLWISDLTKPDVLLLLLMGVTQYFSGKITAFPASPEARKQQELNNIIMSVLFTGMFYFFNIPAGVMLYWFTSNLFQLLQQFIVVKLHLGG